MQHGAGVIRRRTAGRKMDRYLGLRNRAERQCGSQIVLIYPSVTVHLSQTQGLVCRQAFLALSCMTFHSQRTLSLPGSQAL